jgi:hypothetical protein
LNDSIKNRVSESTLITIDLSEFLPVVEPLLFDISSFLFKGLILKEKDYRKSLSEINWSAYNNRTVLVFCSNDAIIPVWAYMLLAAHLGSEAKEVFFLNLDQWKEKVIINNISAINADKFVDARIVIKGCGDIKIPDSAYFEITKILLPVAKSILYGEPCSTVPVYKKK